MDNKSEDPNPQQQQPPQDKSAQPQPVAYDTNGNPLYAAPPSQVNNDSQQGPQIVHLSRAIAPEEQELSPEVKKRHDKSLRDYPHLNLSPGEYIISAVRRHPIGLALPVGLTIFLVALVASAVINYSLIVESIGLLSPPPLAAVAIFGLLLIILFSIGGYVAVWVYVNNKFFLTNESVIQELQTSLFVRKEQTVSLANIEDASFDQRGILQSMFNYGKIRLSTQGDETTYRFDYVSNPKEQIAILNNAVEAFKNGRPING